MPEIWLNYGEADVVLDIRAENLGPQISSAQEAMDGRKLAEQIADGIGDTGKAELALLDHSPSVRRAVSDLYALCEERSVPFPRILAEPRAAEIVRAGLPQGAAVAELGADMSDKSTVFVAEMGLDGLFGFETVATRLLRRFGQDQMLSAYAKRQGNEPAPAREGAPLEEARKFAGGFEIRAIELVAGPGGASEAAVGHPSETSALCKRMEQAAVRDEGRHKAAMISTGKGSSNDTLARSLSSLWNCAGCIDRGGMAVLLAECGAGLGAEALARSVEGRDIDRLKSPPKYVDGMESLLFLSSMSDRLQVGLVSVLPEMYVKKLGMVPMPGSKDALAHVLRTRGPRQKVAVVSDGARVLLR